MRGQGGRAHLGARAVEAAHLVVQLSLVRDVEHARADGQRGREVDAHDVLHEDPRASRDGLCARERARVHTTSSMLTDRRILERREERLPARAEGDLGEGQNALARVDRRLGARKRDRPFGRSLNHGRVREDRAYVFDLDVERVQLHRVCGGLDIDRDFLRLEQGGKSAVQQRRSAHGRR